ncbi:SagB/ThcOx family dehydrogenase [Dehalogenimonas formicexedens]|uniref:SagB/ThcOx family dehydrogenase n=1 Tax=Dehalogenimonas formicexedens TaxID=1839801 RepID=UPI001CEF7462|nr:SagB/ThcOx family dehydrogenase [Dehalogenimonas formicexedens]
MPAPRTTGITSVEEAIAARRSVRVFSDQPLTLEVLSQLLWSLQGMTGKRFRTVPSAGATYPLQIIAAVGTFGITNLAAGCYLYLSEPHTLRAFKSGDLRTQLAKASLGQQAISTAPLNLVIAADYERTRSRYRNRTERYVHMEAGHAAQNLYLQAAALGLGTAAIGAFDDTGMKDILSVPGDFRHLYIIPVGVPAKTIF